MRTVRMTNLFALGLILLSEQDPLSALTSNLCEAFHCESVAVLTRQDDRWIVEASAGDAAPAEPDAATATVPLGSDTVLTALGSDLTPDDIHVLHAFAGQLALARGNEVAVRVFERLAQVIGNRLLQTG